MLTKTQLIEGIQQINQSAKREWLAIFDASALKRYLDHLHWQLAPRGPQGPDYEAGWIREAETPAIITRQPVD